MNGNWNELVCKSVMLATEAEACCPCPSTKKVPEQKMGKPMRYRYNCDEEYDSDGRLTSEDRKIDWLQYRQSQVYISKMYELQRQFGIIDDEAPESADEIIARIKAGKFILPSKEKQENKEWHQSAYGMIRWRDPELKEDKAGYAIALKALDKEQAAVMDAIQISSPEAALATIQALDNWKYSA